MSIETLALVLHHSKASGSDKVILLGIANHDGDGGAWPSIETLMKYGNITERSVQDCLRRLETLGEVRRTINGGGTRDQRGDRRPNRYDVLVTCPADCDRTSQHRTDGVQSSVERGAVERSHGVQSTAPKPSLEPSLEPTTKISPDSGSSLLVPEEPDPVVVPDPIEAEFTGFWDAYPRKVGKKDAAKAYRAARKTATVEEISAGLRAQLPDLRTRGSAYVPHPATWLRQGRWADDPEHAAQADRGRNHYIDSLGDTSPAFQIEGGSQ